jgi:hypothetical protein
MQLYFQMQLCYPYSIRILQFLCRVYTAYFRPGQFQNICVRRPIWFISDATLKIFVLINDVQNFAALLQPLANTDADLVGPHTYYRSRGSSVSIVTDYGLDDRSSIPDRGRGFFF